jgi:hypothetical protein
VAAVVSTAFVRIVLGMLLCVIAANPAASQTEKEPVQAIVKAFDSHPIVMLGEIHGSVQFDALLKELVASPEFAAKVNDVVIEMGNSLYQDTLDRYIAGGDVPIGDLRKVWENVVGMPGGIPLPPYHGLLAAVRDANQKRPMDRRLRVLCGDPPIDWERVHGREDVAPYLPFRDEHYASVVRYEVLAKRHKGLLIMGAGHFVRRGDGKPGLIEQQMRAAFIQPYVIIAGSNIVGTYEDLDSRFDRTPAPWLAEIKGSWLATIKRRADTAIIGVPSRETNPAAAGTWDQAADGYLYLGPRDKLTGGGEAFDLEGTPYGAELRRRWKILFPTPPNSLPKSDGVELPAFRRDQPPPPALPRQPEHN